MDEAPTMNRDAGIGLLQRSSIITRTALRSGWFALGRGSAGGAAQYPGLRAPRAGARSPGQAPAAHAARRHLRATGEPDPTPSVGRSRARTSTRRATPPRATSRRLGEKERDG